jgi:hypothetical protein
MCTRASQGTYLLIPSNAYAVQTALDMLNFLLQILVHVYFEHVIPKSKRLVTTAMNSESLRNNIHHLTEQPAVIQ